MSKDNLKILRTEGEKKMKKAVSGIMLMLLILSMLTLAINIRPVKSMQEPPVLEWDRTYGGIGSDKAYSLVKTNDGGYAVAGDTNSFGVGGSDFWLVKTDSNGNEQWNKTYGGTSDDHIGWLMALAYDGGYTLAGTTNSFGAGDYDFWLVKTDANGMMQWNKTYGGTNDESMCGMIQTNDGGYAMVGRTNSFGAGGYDCWFVKTDSSGNLQWNKTYGSQSYDEMAHAVVQTSDGAYALLGTNHTGYERNDVLLFKLDSNGNVEWNKTYNRSYQNDFGNSLVQNTDGGFTIAGLASSSWAEEYDGWLFRTDANGNMLWSKTYGGGATDQFTSICLTDDGGYGMAGATRSFGAGGFFDFWLVKTDASGNMQWSNTYGGTGWDEARCIVETDDGGYAVAGWTDTFGAGSDDFWLIELTQRARLVDFFLHGDASLNNNSPTATTAKYEDSPSIKFGGGNPWKEIGTWAASASLTDGRLTALGDLGVWLGLKNSDDQGTNFDLRAEVYKNGVLVASGETYLIKGVTRNPDKASKVTVSFGSFSPVDFNGTNDTLSLRILTRIGTDGHGKFGGGHSSAVGLRLYFDAVSRPAMLAVSIA